MISYNALEVEGLKEVLETVATACTYLNIDFFIVGAVARNIWYANSNTELRGTKDIDFGIYVTDAVRYYPTKRLFNREPSIHTSYREYILFDHT